MKNQKDEKNNLKEFGKRVGEVFEYFKKSKDITQIEFCKQFEYNVTNFKKLINGDIGLKFENILKFLDVFGVNSDWLLKGKGSMFSEVALYKKSTSISIVGEEINQIISSKGFFALCRGGGRKYIYPIIHWALKTFDYTTSGTAFTQEGQKVVGYVDIGNGELLPCDELEEFICYLAKSDFEEQELEELLRKRRNNIKNFFSEDTN